MIHRKKKPTKSNKSSTYRNSTRNRRSKIPKFKTYEVDDYDEEENDDDDEEISINATEPNNFESFPNTPETRSSSNLSTNLIMEQKLDEFMNVVPFPIFKGTNEECPFAHLSRFLKVCRANNVSSIQSMTRIFPITLENEAALWFDLNVEPYPFLSWEETKSSFLEAYQKTSFESEITGMKQCENESVRSYFLRLQWVLKIFPDHGLKEEMITRVFVNGLNGEFRDWVVSKNPDSLDDALGLAFDWEKVRGLRKGGEVSEIMGKMRGLGLDEIREIKKNGCQCSKHQCGKKKFDRSDSIVSVKSNNLLT